MPYLAFAAICLLFGSNFYLMSLAKDAYGPIAIGAGRVVGAAVTLGLCWRLAASGTRVPRDKWLPCLAVGLVANGYPYVVQPYLIATAIAIGEGGGHSFFGTMVAFTPLLTILVSIPLLGAHPSVRQLTGVLAGLGFMGLLLSDGSTRGITPFMLAMAFSVPLSYALANTYLRRALNDVPALALSSALLVSPLTLLTPLAFCDGLLEPIHLAGPAEPTNVAAATTAVVILGVFGTGLTMWLFVGLVQSQGPLFAGMVTYVVPLIALLWGRFDGEPITRTQLVAIGGVLAMVALVQSGAAVKNPGPPPAGPDSSPAAGEV